MAIREVKVRALSSRSGDAAATRRSETMKGKVRRLAAMAAAMVVMLVATAGPASAGSSTYQAHVINSDFFVFDEWEYCESSDTWISAEGSVVRRIVVTIDKETDEVVAERRAAKYQLTIWIGDKDVTATVDGNRLVTFDDRTGDFTSTGSHWRVILPGQGTLQLEAGRFAYDGESDTEVYHGLLGNWEAVCAYLGG